MFNMCGMLSCIPITEGGGGGVLGGMQLAGNRGADDNIQQPPLLNCQCGQLSNTQEKLKRIDSSMSAASQGGVNTPPSTGSIIHSLHLYFISSAD